MSSDGYFAFATISGVFCLVLVLHATPLSALTTIDVKIFRHEFITIFRFSENRTLHPDDINIIEPIADDVLRYEEDDETLFLAQVLIDRMRKYTDPRRTLNHGVCSRGKVASRPSRIHTQRQQQPHP